MFIIIDKTTKKIKQVININYGLQINNDEILQEVTNEFISKFYSSYDYKLIFDNEGNITDITVIKTLEQHKEDQVSTPIIVEEVVDSEKVAMAEAIVNLTSEIENLKQQINGGAI